MSDFEPIHERPQRTVVNHPDEISVGVTLGGESDIMLRFAFFQEDGAVDWITFVIPPVSAEALREMIRRTLIERVGNMQ